MVRVERSKGITRIVFRENMREGNPATVNRRTGVVYINPKAWKYLTKDMQKYVLLHEEGHLVLQTTSEEKADAYAWDKYRKQGGSLSAPISLLRNILQGKGQNARLRDQVIRSLVEDWRKNGNRKSLNHFKRLANA